MRTWVAELLSSMSLSELHVFNGPEHMPSFLYTCNITCCNPPIENTARDQLRECLQLHPYTKEGR